MTNKFFATCKIGLESLVAAELKGLGIEVKAVHDARVDFSGSFTDMAISLLNLRTAERVLMEVGSFRAVTFEELYEGVRAIRWQDYLTKTASSTLQENPRKASSFRFPTARASRKKRS